MALGSEMPIETQETDIPRRYEAQWGGDELRDLEDAKMKRNGKQSKRRERRKEQVTKRKTATAMTGKVICGSERERES